MSQEIETNESEVIEEEVLADEVEDNEEDLGEDQDNKDIDWQARALRAEGAIVKNKQNSKKKVSKPQKTNSNQDNQIDLLRFNGVTSDEIDRIKKIAVMEDIDFIDAHKSEDFTIWKEKQAREVISKQATVGASKRGRSVTENIDQVQKRIMEGKGSAADLKLVRDSK